MPSLSIQGAVLLFMCKGVVSTPHGTWFYGCWGDSSRKRVPIPIPGEQQWCWVPAKHFCHRSNRWEWKKRWGGDFSSVCFNRVPQTHIPLGKNIWVALAKATRPYSASALLCLRTHSRCVWSVSLSLPTSCNVYVTAPLHLWPAQLLNPGNSSPTSGNPLFTLKGVADFRHLECR